MKLKFSIGTGKTFKNISTQTEEYPFDQYTKSNFFYLSFNGLAKEGTLKKDFTKIPNDEIVDLISNKQDEIIALMNNEDVLNKEYIVSKSTEGLSNIKTNSYNVSIYKKEIWYDRFNNTPMEEPIWTPVVLDENFLNIRDFNIGNNRTYKYLFKYISNTLSKNRKYFVGWNTSFKTNWLGWSIVELHETDDKNVFTAEPKDVWRFKYNISPGTQTQNIIKTQQDTLARYPVFSHGVQNAISGSVECLLGREMINANYSNTEWVYKQNPATTEYDMIWQKKRSENRNLGGYKERLGHIRSTCGNDGEYLSASTIGFKDLTSNEAVDMLNKWREVCYSGNPKLLKDEKGQTFIIQITASSNTTNEEWNGAPETISFDWIEIANAKDCRVVQKTTSNT